MTDRTPNLKLGQYGGGTKPTWADVSADNRRIDREFARMRNEIARMRLYIENVLPTVPGQPVGLTDNGDGTVTIG